MVPGEYHVKPDQIALNIGWATCRVVVENHGDRPVQVGSHYHFVEVNPASKFDRRQATGYRLNIPTGTTVRFEPDRRREVELVAFIGHHAVFGFRDEATGPPEANGE